MTATDTSTTIDLAPLLALRDEVALVHAQLIQRVNAGDVTAWEQAGALLAREDQYLEAIQDQLAEHYPTDTDGLVDIHASDGLNAVVRALAATGDLAIAHDAFRDRVEDAAVDAAVEAFAAALDVPAVREWMRDHCVGELRRLIAEGRMGPDEWNEAQAKRRSATGS
jgi:hypothetical protein